MFYEQVKSLCDERHIAISTLARKLNLSPSAPANWKAGTLPKAETLIKISEFFGVSVDFLLFGADRATQNTATTQDAAVLQSSGGSSMSVATGEVASIWICKDLNKSLSAYIVNSICLENLSLFIRLIH